MKSLLAVVLVASLFGCGGKSEREVKIEACAKAVDAALTARKELDPSKCPALNPQEADELVKLVSKKHPDFRFSPTSKPKPDKSLGMQPTAFLARLDKAFKEFDLDVHADNCKVASGEKRDSMQCRLLGVKDAGLLITLNKEDQSAREVTFVLDNTSKSAVLKSMMIMAAAVEAIDSPEIRKNSGDWLSGLIKEGATSKKQYASTVVNGFEYVASFPEGLGLWFVIARPDKSN